MAIKLIAIDTDGTLLNSDGEILESTKIAIKKALNKGIRVVLSSGRPIDGLKGYMNELEIMGSGEYVITLNGAIVRNADDDIISENLLPNSYYRILTAFGLANKIPFNIVDANSRIITTDHNVDPMIYQQAYENQDPLYIRNPEELPEEKMRIAKGCFVGDSYILDEFEPKIRKEFKKDLSVIRTDPYFLELFALHVNKGNALRELASKLNITQAEIMVVGDEYNDISMFENCGTSVCMANGDEEAKKAADYITSSNDEDGISEAFDKFVF